MTVSNLTTANNGAAHFAYPDERQRAGYLALGLLLVVAALIGLKIPMMPSALFIFGAALCFVQLSSSILGWLETNRSTRLVIDAWRALGALSFLFRLCLLSLVTAIGLGAVVLNPHLFGVELAINAMLFAGLMLFVGPQYREVKFVPE